MDKDFKKCNRTISNHEGSSKWPRLRSASEFPVIFGGEENAAQPHFPPLPNSTQLRSPSDGW